ncbi:hypothetical protein [Pseudonocardia sp. GCM10023141]|uniref:hypothetical protein n=1 Tax=Pseudonocardia sp. GCM10023141 TaxID=3252653 RepID=UPI00360F5DA6
MADHPAMITEVVGELLDAMAAGPKPVDLVTAYTLPLPSMMICRMLGVPYADHGFFQRISAALLNNRTAPDVALAASTEPTDYLRELVHAKDADPGDDLISRLVLRRVRTGEIDTEELVSMANLLFIAGRCCGCRRSCTADGAGSPPQTSRSAGSPSAPETA